MRIEQGAKALDEGHAADPGVGLKRGWDAGPAAIGRWD